MNIKSKAFFQKEDGIYKVIDDFRKIRLFEIDCAPSCSNFKTSLGNVRQKWVGNTRIARALNGALLVISDITEDFLIKAMDFSTILKKLADTVEYPEHTCEHDVCKQAKHVMSVHIPSGKSYHGFEGPANPESTNASPIIQGIGGGGVYGQLNSNFTKSLQVTPIGPSTKSRGIMSSAFQLQPVPSTIKDTPEPSEQSKTPAYMKVFMTTCEDYPRTIEIHNFDIFNNLRYSCGWKLASTPEGSTITYIYDMLDIYMIYELSLQKHYDGMSCDSEMTGMYTATVMMPSHTKDLKKHIYDTIRREARMWDDILHLCHLIINKFQTDWLKDYLRNHKNLVINEFAHYLGDQKSTK